MNIKNIIFILFCIINFILLLYMFILCYKEKNKFFEDNIDNNKIKNLIKQNINILEFPISELIDKLALLQVKYDNLNLIYNNLSINNKQNINNYEQKKNDIKNLKNMIDQYQKEIDNIKI